jgi:hypothetical protein
LPRRRKPVLDYDEVHIRNVLAGSLEIDENC